MAISAVSPSPGEQRTASLSTVNTVLQIGNVVAMSTAFSLEDKGQAI
jgi:hypothetical protein